MMMIPTLTKLLATRIVASNLSGISISLITKLLLLDFDFFSFSISPGLREKKATSDPETKADEIIKTMPVTNATNTPNEACFISISVIINITWWYDSVSVSKMNE